MATRLAEIYRSEKKTGGGLASSIGKSLKEKIDPRQMLDQSGLLVSMFPSLKSFNATRGKGVAEKVSSNVGGGIDNSVLNTLAATSSLTAKNTMTLPMMARDMNLTKLNIMKLVKATGQKSTMNHDAFWNNAKTRESAYENTIGKIAGKGMIGKMAKSAFVGKQNRDGQSPESALFVQTGGESANTEGMLSGLLNTNALKSILTATVGFLTSPIALTVMGGAALFGIMKTLMDKNSDKEGVDLATKALGGGLDESQIGSEIMNAAEEGQRQREAESLKNRTVSGPLQRQMPAFDSNGSDSYDSPQTTEGYGVDEKGATPVPSNVIRSGSGAPIMTGSGGYVTSGEASTTPSPVSSTAPTGPIPPSPTPMGSGLGKLSAKFESAKEGPSAIGYDSTGGTSYGTYQIASKTGTMSQFLAFLDKSNPDLANQLRNAGDPNTGSKKGPFPDVWKKIAAQDPKGFDKLQHDFIQKTHYDPAAKQLMKLGFNINEQSDAMKDVLWSTSVQHGAAGAVGIFSKAIKELGVSASPEKLINKIYEERGTKFGSSTEGVQKSVLNRFSEESKMAVASLNSGTQSTPSAAPPSPSSGTAVASTSTSVADGKMAAMTPSGGNTNVINKPTTVASNESSPGGKASTAYDNELFQTLVGLQSLSA
jgi:hypothetical protein